MKHINWGVLGAANIAYNELVPAIRRSTTGKVIAVASRDKEKGKRFQTEKVYGSYEALLADETIDAVYIPLPNSLHKEWAVKAMNAGKHVLVEKPATLTVKDMYEIRQAAERNHVIFMEAFMYQYHSQHAFVQALLSNGTIGDYEYVKAHFSFKLDDPEDIRLNKELGGGALWDVGCYGIHALTQIVGMKPITVSALGKLQNDSGVDLTSVCFFRDQNNRSAEVSSTFEGSFVDRYEIFGEKGAIIVENAFRPDLSENGTGIVRVINHDGHTIQQKTFKDDQYLKQIEHFHACIINDETPIYHAEQSLEVINYIEKAYESLYNQAKVININLK